MSNSVHTFAGLTTTITVDENTVNATPQLIDADVTFTDLDGNLIGTTLTVTGLLLEDIVSIRNQGTGAGQIGFSGGTVTYEGTVIGVASGGAGGTFTVSFLFGATAAAVEALIENLTYANSSDAPTLSRTLELKITDVAGIAAGPPLAFEQQTGADNPFDGVTTGQSFATPTLADLDGDGDLDMLSGSQNGDLFYFQNTGSATAPDFAAPIMNPFGLVAVPSHSGTAFGDLDGDGDFDLVVSTATGPLHYFRNVGTAVAPSFVEQFGVDNPFNLLDAGSIPSLGDLDGDGDLDLVGGNGSGLLTYLENTGTTVAPIFVLSTTNPFEGIDLGSFSAPSLGDVDGDGDLDVVVGSLGLPTVHYLENTGTATAPSFIEHTGGSNPLSGVTSTGVAPALGDLDSDGDLDAVIGLDPGGAFEYFKNTTPPASTIGFVQRTGADNPFDGVATGQSFSTPTFADLDGDGDLDMLSGANTGGLFYFENTGSATTPVFAAPISNPFGLTSVPPDCSPAFADLDADGDYDLVVANFDGSVHYFKNVGSALLPSFVEQTGTDNPFDLLNPGSADILSFGDLDGDGDLDLVVGIDLDPFGGGDGRLVYFENTGTATAPMFVLSAANPFDGFVTEGFSAPSLGDVDGDGDLDVVVGSETTHYLENIGTANAPSFIEHSGGSNPFSGVTSTFVAPALADLDNDGDLDAVIGLDPGGAFEYFEYTTPPRATTGFVPVAGAANPFNGVDVGSDSAPAFADLDGDGDLDLVVGARDGTLSYFENTGTAIAPIFVQRTGVDNPFDGIFVGDFVTPTFADFNGDGTLDMAVGYIFGNLRYFANTGSAIAPAFALTGGFDGLGAYSAPAFADLDADGDVDIMAGEANGTLNYFANTGTAISPFFAAPTPDPFGFSNVGSYSAPAFGDLDGDGDLDLVVGELVGRLNYFENTGTAEQPTFVQRTGAANPFDGINVGSLSTPTFADLDGDGDLDLVVGEHAGNLNYFRNTGAGFEFIIDINEENDAPVNTVPGAQTVAEDTDLAITGLAIDDVDIGFGTIMVTLHVDHGTIHVRDDVAGGIDAFDISGNDTDTVTLNCDPSLISVTLAALNGVIYRPDPDYNGPDTLTMTADDQGFTGTGNVLTDIDTVNITVTPVNDSAENDEPGPGGNSAFLNYTENQVPTAINTTLSFTDPDDLTLPFGRVSIVSGYQANQDVLGFVNDGATMGNIAIVSNVGGVLTLGSAGNTATVAQWNNALHAVTYFNSSDTPSTVNRVLSYEVDDGGGFTVVDDATIGITAVNDAANDFNGDGKSDILFQNTNGSPAIWLLNGTTITAQALIGANPGTAWHVIGSGDINGDEKADILFQHDDGTVAAYQMNGTTILSQATLGANPGPAWNLIGSGDFNGDHKDDLLWQHDDGSVAAWLMNGTSVASTAFLGQNPGTAWNVIGTGDFNGDGKADILWQNDNGTAGVWLMDGTDVLSTAAVGSNPGAAWNVIGAGDFNGDLKADILWQHDNGTVGVWLMDGTSVLSTAAVGTNPGSAWNVIGPFDVNGDGKSDVLFQHDDGTPGVWLMDGVTVTATSGIGTNPGSAWNIIPEHDLVV